MLFISRLFKLEDCRRKLIITAFFLVQFVGVKRAAAQTDQSTETGTASSAHQTAEQSTAARRNSHINDIAMPAIKARSLIGVALCIVTAVDITAVSVAARSVVACPVIARNRSSGRAI